MADRHHHVLFGDEVADVDRADFFATDLGATRVAVFSFQLDQILTNQLANVLIVGQNARVLGDFVEQLLMLRAELLLFEVHQLTERHPQNGVGLHGGQRVRIAHASLGCEDLESLVAQGAWHEHRGSLDAHQPGFRLGLRGTGANDANHLVDVRMRQQQAFDRVLSLPGSQQ